MPFIKPKEIRGARPAQKPKYLLDAPVSIGQSLSQTIQDMNVRTCRGVVL
jgi:hypothetical protein